MLLCVACCLLPCVGGLTLFILSLFIVVEVLFLEHVQRLCFDLLQFGVESFVVVLAGLLAVVELLLQGVDLEGEAPGCGEELVGQARVGVLELDALGRPLGNLQSQLALVQTLQTRHGRNVHTLRVLQRLQLHTLTIDVCKLQTVLLCSTWKNTQARFT